MRIGIYTQPLRYNYGGLLQSWALQAVLRRMGHDVVTFDPCPYRHMPYYKKPFAYAKRAFKRLIDGKTVIRYELKYNREHDAKMKNLKPFVDENIQRMEFRTVSDININLFDMLIVGSDQVWRPKYNRTYGRTIENAFFDFASKAQVKRIAYAASFGTDEWEYTEKQTARCSRLAKKFDVVSVREQASVALCKQYLGVDSVCVLDPTMLLAKEDYIQLVRNSQTEKSKGNLMCYMIDGSDEKRMLIDKIANDRHLVPFYGNNPKLTDKTLPPMERIQPPVEQWLRGFMDTEFVVTDSFHACVFSIIFRKPFIVIGNEERGMSRYYSLLSMFGLEKHLLLHTSDYQSGEDYQLPEDISVKLSDWQQESLDFLKKSLDS